MSDEKLDDGGKRPKLNHDFKVRDFGEFEEVVPNPSRTGNVYTTEALEQMATLIEGKPVYMGQQTPGLPRTTPAIGHVTGGVVKDGKLHVTIETAEPISDATSSLSSPA